MKLNEKFLSAICHRKPARSFKLSDSYSALCVRCSSTFIGAFTTIALLAVFKASQEFNYLLLLFFLPIVLDGVTQTLALRKSCNILRYFTGWFAGIAIGVLAYGFIFVFWFGGKLVIASPAQLLVLMLLGSVLYILLLACKNNNGFSKLFNWLTIVSLYSVTLLFLFLSVSFAVWLI